MASVVPIPQRIDEVEPLKKTVAANQKAIDALAFNSGTWRVQGVQGLYIRCRAHSKSYFLQRRVRGQLMKETIGQLSLKHAREKVMKSWSALKPKPAANQVVTLEIAIDRYLEEKSLAAKTIENYRYNGDHYLADWKRLGLHAVGDDRAGFRFLINQIKKNHGVATSNQVVRLVSAVYRWQRKIDLSLPESPTVAVQVDPIPPRDWAYSAEELAKWWYQRKKEEGGETAELGVKTLGPIKRMWWLTALFTGARKGSIEALRWRDLDLDKRTIHFRVNKGDRPYLVPMSPQAGA